MKGFIPIISVCFSLQLTGCALLPFGHDEPNEMELDPVAAVARRYRDPNSVRLTDEDLERRDYLESRLEQARERGDVIVGMKMDDVVTAMGEPVDVEIAGSPGLGNEKWVYYRRFTEKNGLGDARYIYFERGQVSGWETVTR